MCACGTEVETTEHFLLRCQFYCTQRLELFENLEKVEPNFLSLSAKNQVLILWYGSRNNNSENLNQEILKYAISYLKYAISYLKYVISYLKYVISYLKYVISYLKYAISYLKATTRFDRPLIDF